MTEAQAAQAEEIDRQMQFEVEGDGLVYTCNDQLRVRKQVHVNLMMNPQHSNRFGHFCAHEYPLNSNGFKFIVSTNIDVAIPHELDVTREVLKALQEEKEKVLKEMQEKLQVIDRTMQELLALPAPSSTGETPPPPMPHPVGIDDDIPF